MNTDPPLSDLLLKSHSEIKELLQEPGFEDFALQVYRYLDRMTPGTTLDLLKYSGTKLRWVMKTCCIFLAEGDHWFEYEFLDDYVGFRRWKVTPQEWEWLRRIRKKEEDPEQEAEEA